jgi:hypothetical protein
VTGGTAESAPAARPGAVSLGAHALHFGLALLVVLLESLGNLKEVLRGTLVDPDSYMRLIRIREALEHGAWFGSSISHDASGQGFDTSWGHELDLCILLLRAPLLLILPPDAALYWAGAIIGPISVGLLGLVCAWAVAPLAPARWRWLAAFAVAGFPPIAGYGELGEVTHHIALAAAVVAAWGAGGRAAFGALRAGALLGLFTALGIWLSPETMPFAMLAFAAVFLAWLVEPDRPKARVLGAAGTAFLLALAVILAIDPPPAGYAAVELERLSITFLCLAFLVFALSWLPRALGTTLSVGVRAAILLVAGCAAVAIWLALFPGYLGGLSGVMTDEGAQAIAPSNAEWQSLDTPALFIAVAGPGTLAVLAALGLGIRRRGGLAGVLWLFAGLCGLGCVVLGALHLRFTPYQSAIGAMMLPVLLSLVPEDRSSSWRILLRPGLIALFLIVPPVAAQIYQPVPIYSATGADTPDGPARCPMPAAFTLLAPYSDKIVVADMNIGPELLYRTGVKIVGSLYLGNVAGTLRLRAAWRARDLDAVPAELRAAGAQYVLSCRGTRRSPFVDGPQTTLFDRLNRGDPPAWLRPVAQGDGTGWTLYEVPPALNTPS